jgi:hypothetical protein
MLNNEIIIEKNRCKLKTWLEQNVCTYGGELFDMLLKTQQININDIENLYSELDRSEFESDDEYNYCLENQEPQEVYQWFVVTKEGYNKFKMLGYPVTKYNSLYFYGRTSYNQLIFTDFYYLPNYKLNDFFTSI